MTRLSTWEACVRLGGMEEEGGMEDMEDQPSPGCPAPVTPRISSLKTQDSDLRSQVSDLGSRNSKRKTQNSSRKCPPGCPAPVTPCISSLKTQDSDLRSQISGLRSRISELKTQNAKLKTYGAVGICERTRGRCASCSTAHECQAAEFRKHVFHACVYIAIARLCLSVSVCPSSAH